MCQSHTAATGRTLTTPSTAVILSVEDNPTNQVPVTRLLAFFGAKTCEWKASGWGVWSLGRGAVFRLWSRLRKWEKEDCALLQQWVEALLQKGLFDQQQLLTDVVGQH